MILDIVVDDFNTFFLLIYLVVDKQRKSFSDDWCDNKRSLFLYISNFHLKFCQQTFYWALVSSVQ